MSGPFTCTRAIRACAAVALILPAIARAQLLTEIAPTEPAPLAATDPPARSTMQPETERRALGAPPADASGARKADRPGSTSTGGWIRTAFSLAAVIALIFAVRSGVRWITRRSGSLASELSAAGRAPSGVLEVLGRYPVARGHSLVLLRIDRRVLLLGQSTSGFRTLADISDPDEVASLVMKTRDEEGASNAAKFTDLLRSLERDSSLVAEHVGTPAPASAAERALAIIRGRLAGSGGAGA